MEVAEGGSLCRRCLFPADHLTFFCVKESGSVVSEGPAVAGREFFPFGCFEHRMASGAGNTSPWRVRLMPAETPVPVSPLL
jgi:hypothetical protein